MRPLVWVCDEKYKIVMKGVKSYTVFLATYC